MLAKSTYLFVDISVHVTADKTLDTLTAWMFMHPLEKVQCSILPNVQSCATALT